MIIKTLKEETPWSGVVARICNPCTREHEESGWLRVPGQTQWEKETLSQTPKQQRLRKEEGKKFPRWVGGEELRNQIHFCPLSGLNNSKVRWSGEIPLLKLSKFRMPFGPLIQPLLSTWLILRSGYHPVTVFSQWTTHIHTHTVCLFF